MRLLLLAVSVYSAHALALAQTPSLMTVEDVLALASVSSPEMSPDGSRVAYGELADWITAQPWSNGNVGGSGEAVELAIAMHPTSVLFRAGHRIRLAIAGADKDTSAPVADAEDQPVTWTVEREGSYLELPTVVPTSSSG